MACSVQTEPGNDADADHDGSARPIDRTCLAGWAGHCGHGCCVPEKLGYLPQDFGVYPNFTAEQFLLYIARLKGLSKFEAKRQTDDLLHMVGLEDKSRKS